MTANREEKVPTGIRFQCVVPGAFFVNEVLRIAIIIITAEPSMIEHPHASPLPV